VIHDTYQHYNSGAAYNYEHVKLVKETP